MSVLVRPAALADAELIFSLICELADYEKLRHEVRATQGRLADILFGPNPRAWCDIVEVDDAPQGFALWFYNVS
ncbi:MAG TPA: GNAT family N-acetyltransferase, partial [Caulobacteraceae bacterium]|nr:GNAT family N-acetyltransferase [Caulobacteraceae bacterium]